MPADSLPLLIFVHHPHFHQQTQPTTRWKAFSCAEPRNSEANLDILLIFKQFAIHMSSSNVAGGSSETISWESEGFFCQGFQGFCPA